ncbi:MAG: hypothetical protein ACM3UO_00375 [Bacillota bacterium]
MSTTSSGYDNWDELVAAEANGWCVVVMMSRRAKKSGREQFFARVIGPFDTKREAHNQAQAVRREWRKASARHEIEPGTHLLSVGVEPAWKRWGHG